jgi:hypothetical protein
LERCVSPGILREIDSPGSGILTKLIKKETDGSPLQLLLGTNGQRSKAPLAGVANKEIQSWMQRCFRGTHRCVKLCVAVP